MLALVTAKVGEKTRRRKPWTSNYYHFKICSRTLFIWVRWSADLPHFKKVLVWFSVGTKLQAHQHVLHWYWRILWQKNHTSTKHLQSLKPTLDKLIANYDTMTTPFILLETWCSSWLLRNLISCHGISKCVAFSYAFLVTCLTQWTRCMLSLRNVCLQTSIFPFFCPNL